MYGVLLCVERCTALHPALVPRVLQSVLDCVVQGRALEVGLALGVLRAGLEGAAGGPDGMLCGGDDHCVAAVWNVIKECGMWYSGVECDMAM